MSGNITFISAGAGSGKTYCLTQILHKELKGDVTPAGIIATTFTKKAAAELRERVRGHLLEEGELPLANAIGQARIGTVNSICGDLLGRFAFEAGLSPQLRVLEEVQSELLYQESIEAAMSDTRIGTIYQMQWRLGIERWSDDVMAIANLARSNGVDSATLISFAEINAASLLELFPPASAGNIENDVLRELDALIPQIEAAVADKPNQKNLQNWLEELQTFRQKLKENRLVWSEWAKLEKSSPPAKLQDISQPLLDAVKAYEAHPTLHADIRGYIEAIFRIASEALQTFEERKRGLGAIDFIDQERKLLDILDLPEVKKALTGEIELLMVDEFQDTSPIQLALFTKLARLAKRTYWVGDTKQAIYGFRGSDSRLMEAILKDLEMKGSTPQTLDSSWRSRPALVMLANEIFGKAFADILPQDRIRLDPKRKDYSNEPALQSWGLKASNKDEQVQAIAAGIRALVTEGYLVQDKNSGAVRKVTYADIAVLARMNDSVLKVADALSEAGIPTETSQPGLLKKPESVLAIACLRRLTDEADTLATAEIVSLTSGDEPEVWLQRRLNYLASHEQETWNNWLESGDDANPIMRRLAELRPRVQVLTVKEALELVIAECHADANVLSWSASHAKARMRLANLQALVGMAAAYEESCRGSGRIASIPGFLVWLSEQAKKGLDSLADAGTDSVRVLTYHASKGLEWPVTICTELGSNIRDRLWGASVQPKGKIDVSNPLKNRFIRFWPWPFGKQQKVPLAERADQSPLAAPFHADAVEEAKRLMYVGLTRARDSLILASPIGRSGDLASGEWVEALDCPQLLEKEATEIAFDSGVTIPCVYKEFAPGDMGEPLAADGQQLYWFQQKPVINRLPLISNPSAAASVPCHIAEIATIGTPIKTKGSPNLGQLGLAVHASIAAAVSDRANLNSQLVLSMLDANGVSGFVSTNELVSQMGAFLDWCQSRYGDAPMLAEHPVEMVMENGQWVVGQIDLLIDTPEGWVLIDHKASMKAEESFPELAAGYSGQLGMYRQALESATSKKVIESWLYLPILGKVIRVKSNGITVDTNAIVS
jgi:ATP-dependent exoDNAse (exonuclease V) beta subunit